MSIRSPVRAEGVFSHKLWLTRLVSVALMTTMLPIAPHAEESEAHVFERLAIEAGVGLAIHELQVHGRRPPGAIPGTAANDNAGAVVSHGTGCASQLPNGRAPQFASASWSVGLTQLCYEELTIGYSSKTRTPLWVGEYLTPQRIEAARQQMRNSKFFEDPHLPVDDRARLSDYVRSGYDRGHMAPNGDFSNAKSQAECFTLANIVPQDPDNNRHAWESLESGTRNYVMAQGAIYVVTGPLFRGEQILFLNDRVAIPTDIWKLVYNPAKHAGGYMVRNEAHPTISWMNIAAFEKLSGYRFGLGTVALMEMPATKAYRSF
jgi:endonuclease G